MSQTKAQLVNPLHGNINVTGSVGIISANYFVAQNPIESDISGNITGTACTFTTLVGALTGDATGLSGSPNIVVNNLTVNGTETIINTDELHVSDKTIGIGSTSAPSSTTQDGSGIILYGQTPVNFLYDNDKAAVGLNTALNVAGFVTATSALVGGVNTLNATGINVAGVVTATTFSGVVSGVEIESGGSSVGAAITAINFSSGATITADAAVGISTITIDTFSTGKAIAMAMVFG